MKKVIIFDLDGTLAESKQPLDADMAALLKALVDGGYRIAVMSGGSFAQYERQFLPFLTMTNNDYRNLFLLPTSGAALYRYDNDDWHAEYIRTIPQHDRSLIIETLHEAAQSTGNVPEKIYGEQIEDRGSQITYSALGQDAPIDAKRSWDPDQARRKKIVASFTAQLPQFMTHIGGMTSIDVTEKGIDKTYGIRQLSKLLAVPVEDMIFVGDALYPGGNDEPAKASGVECVPVATVADTKAYIRAMLSQ